ncbi:alpha/beta fold hydrolase [Compostimonas suwonensis]|uniref:Pimeloyl-ACP methyl ester carboxylesterase n=1 Tax=Compostimonas suwonensis TaxID=1048394 RepID=A0A2M9BWT4_9MICO|nr:alpha/beta hydrolase [Compostimonas suwonensis]PJJ62409.1 pimeloyl-ACP methyl ester carboxylesterase [Compostimonas suwonensis]
MPEFALEDGRTLFYRVDDFTEPWGRPETVVMLHGNAESSESWYGWVPELSGDLRVVRPDIRGFGLSTPMPEDFPWTLDVIRKDLIGLLDSLGIDRFHLVGAKLGGTIARHLASAHPDRVSSLVVAGTPAPHRGVGPRPELIREVLEHGVEAWARRSMAGRLGPGFPDQGVEWWISYMSRTAPSTVAGFLARIADADIADALPLIRCPTLVITTEGSGLSSVEETREWQRRIPLSELLVLPGDSYHVAVSNARECARAALEFITRVRENAGTPQKGRPIT